jgi:signal transduction histidine kinase
MSADLVRANALRRQMTADIAHDLRNPLTVVAGYLESMRDGVLKPSPARFETMYQETRHLQHLVQDLRTLSLSDAGELSLNCQPTSPEELLDRIAAVYQQHAAQQGIKLSVEAEPNLPQINVDPERMVQVLNNLLDNALRYTPSGGHIILSARAQADVVQLMVTDTGSGIAPKDLPHVFDRFYRADTSRHQTKGESGLGLAIAKSITEAHGASIAVQSAQGTGTTFTMTWHIREPLDRD